MDRVKWGIIVKANANYTCQECGLTELLQAHSLTSKHNDLKDGICLCADCHANQHPDIPRGLFFNKHNQPHWHNISASSLAKKVGVHSRTIIRRAKKLGLLKMAELNPEQQAVLLKPISEAISKATKNYRLKPVSIIPLSLKDIAQWLNISCITVKRWFTSGELTIIKLSPTLWRVKVGELDSLLKAKAS